MTAEEMLEKFEARMHVKEIDGEQEELQEVHFSKEHEEKMKKFFDDLRKQINEN